jgi:hypothetical protein
MMLHFHCQQTNSLFSRNSPPQSLNQVPGLISQNDLGIGGCFGALMVAEIDCTYLCQNYIYLKNLIRRVLAVDYRYHFQIASIYEIGNGKVLLFSPQMKNYALWP